MDILCEMYITEFFKFSGGETALVGKVVPNLDRFILKNKADLYIDQQKVRTINILGEDIFAGGDKEKRGGKRAIRTDDDVSEELKGREDKEVKLIIYINN